MYPFSFLGNNRGRQGRGRGQRQNSSERGRIGSGRFPASDERVNRNHVRQNGARSSHGNTGNNSEQSRTNTDDARASRNPAGGDKTSGRSHKPSPLHFQKLKRMLTADTTDVVLDLLKHEEQLQDVLEDENMREDFLEMLLEILAKVINYLRSVLEEIIRR